MAAVEKYAAVGWRVRVFWEDDDEWFEGVVAEYSPESGYFVQYDDGEEQWEAETAVGNIQFLSGPPSTSNETQLILAQQDEEERSRDGKWSAQPPPSTRGEDDGGYEDEYDEDHEDEEEDHHVSSRQPVASSPKPEAEAEAEEGDEEAIATPPKRSAPPLRQPRDPTKYVKSGVFFRDPETLRETKASLIKENRELTEQLDELTSQMQRKEQLSSALKSELHGLKAQVTLTSVMGHSKPKTKGPKTAKEWAEVAIEHKAANRQTRAQLSNLQTQLTKRQMAIQQMLKQRDELQTKLARVPRKELCSLVDLQVEIAQVMNEKRVLEAQLAKKLTAERTPKPKTMSSAGSESKQANRDVKTELEKELRALEKQLMRVSDDMDQWRLAFEKERAKILPVKARLTSLQEELHKYESSKVLLRSVFLRLDRSGTGTISLDAALDAFALLVPEDRKETSQQLKQTMTSQTLDFAEFTKCFQQFVGQ